MTSTLSPADRELVADALLDLGDAVEVVLADVDHGQHRPVGEQEVRLQQLARTRPSAPARYSGRPSDSASYAACSASISLAERLVELGLARAPGSSRFSTVSRSARASSISTTRRCSSGSAGPGDVVVVERPQHEHDRVDLADVGRGTCCRGPRPCWRPRPARRCRRPAPRRARRSSTCSSPPAGRAARRAPWPRRCSGPWWRTAYGAASAPPPVRALYSELLPALGRPTRPKRSIAKE